MTDGIEEIHEADDDLRFADPYAHDIPEYFRERRNYIQADKDENR